MSLRELPPPLAHFLTPKNFLTSGDSVGVGRFPGFPISGESCGLEKKQPNAGPGVRDTMLQEAPPAEASERKRETERQWERSRSMGDIGAWTPGCGAEGRRSM